MSTRQVIKIVGVVILSGFGIGLGAILMATAYAIYKTFKDSEV